MCFPIKYNLFYPVIDVSSARQVNIVFVKSKFDVFKRCFLSSKNA